MSSEDISVEDKDINAKFNEIKKDLKGEKNIDEKRLRNIIMEDLMKEKLLDWLELNNSVIENSPPKEESLASKNKKKEPIKEKTSNKSETKS